MFSALVDDYITLLKSQNTIHNLYSKSAYGHLPFHIQDCYHIANICKKASCVIDLGSGAGLPSVILAIRNSHQHVIAIESKIKKQDFLCQVKDVLKLENLEVYRGDIQHFETHRSNVAEFYTAKAFAPKNDVIKMVKKMSHNNTKLVIPMSENQVQILKSNEKGYIREVLYEERMYYYYVQSITRRRP
ncbi:MAG: class I SAM-dependent methyltransferase [Candidatus Margulisbacteria bacterium]|nr:class I SAM-dependent methyltransferase [Candidatus Margulisiibacteriota bacterium]